MTYSKQLLGAVSSVALIALSASPALAAGTTAGTSIENTVSVDFKVGGVDQTQQTASDTFTVDRKIGVTVAEVGGADTIVSPAQTGAVTTFTVTNNSNDVVDFALAVTQSAADQFDVTSVKIYQDANGDGLWDAGDTLVTHLDEMAEDETRTVFVLGDVAASRVTDDVAEVTLTATTHAGGTASSLGAVHTATVGANTAGVDTVFADTAGDSDAANDGKHSASDSYKVTAADLTVSKTSLILNDPVNGTTDPKAIPGAEIMYCVTVANASGSATATNVTLSDTLPGDVTFVASSININGDASCATGTAGGAYDGGTTTVSGTLSDIAAGETRSLYFKATIN